MIGCIIYIKYDIFGFIIYYNYYIFIKLLSNYDNNLGYYFYLINLLYDNILNLYI